MLKQVKNFILYQLEREKHLITLAAICSYDCETIDLVVKTVKRIPKHKRDDFIDQLACRAYAGFRLDDAMFLAWSNYNGYLREDCGGN